MTQAVRCKHPSQMCNERSLLTFLVRSLSVGPPKKTGSENPDQLAVFALHVSVSQVSAIPLLTLMSVIQNYISFPFETDTNRLYETEKRRRKLQVKSEKA